jgi:Flp pilus assembly protein TadB
MPAWLTVRVALYVAGAIAVILALAWLYSAITAKPKAEARLATNQAQAASQSGSDAVNVVGKAGEREAASDDLSRSNEKDIRNAQGSDAPVAAPARDAGIAALCRRAAYHDDARCVRLRNGGPDPR